MIGKKEKYRRTNIGGTYLGLPSTVTVVELYLSRRLDKRLKKCLASLISLYCIRMCDRKIITCATKPHAIEIQLNRSYQSLLLTSDVYSFSIA